MRLWHKDLITVLPRQQLIGQWRECCSIAKKLAKEIIKKLDIITTTEDPNADVIIKGNEKLVDDISNFYIRSNRKRFWKSENDSDKTEAYEALYIALKTFSQVAAPFIPFITESMWQNLRNDEDPISVHLSDYPVAEENKRDFALEFKMDTVQKAVSMGRSLRSQYNLKNRQPLRSVEFVTRNPEEKAVLLEMEESIREELNVKKVVFHEREDELVEYSAKANFKVLGKELGPLMKAASAVIAALDQSSIQSILEGGTLSIDVEGKTVELTEEKIIVERHEKAALKVVNDGTLTVALDSEITEELKLEGYVRDFVRGIQNLRKESGFEVTDRIEITASGNETLEKAFNMFADYISSETLAEKATWVSSLENATDISADEETWKAVVKRV